MATRTAIWWIRRDQRLVDNAALHAAMSNADQIVPLFILDDQLLSSRYSSDKRTAFMFAGLRSLDEDLRAIGGSLIVRRGNPIEVLRQVIQETSAAGIFAEHDFSPYATRRDSNVVNQLPLTLLSQPSVAHPDDVLKKDGSPYTVYTPYSKAWKASNPDAPHLEPAPERITVPEIESHSLPETPKLPESVPFEAGYAAAHHRLKQFTEGNDAPVFTYEEQRNRIDLDATSRMSPYLRFGMISPREAIAAAMRALDNAPSRDARHSAETWLNELIWREFYVAILHHFPYVRTIEFQDQYRGMHWINDTEDRSAWENAETGYPIVDACIRQLHSEGWMHNRGRMITASFLVKHLLVDWRAGEEHFMQHLLDGDPASNNGGWQWTAGTGTDAAPYFRVFNPILQSRRHDPSATFIRKWIPELTNVPDRFIHEPWTMSQSDQQESGCAIGADYPEPIVEHTFARQRALAAYKQSDG
ncbi:MAG: deoxyribodipyrimidine photo-lyase [Sphaerobacteraceae bacterium]|nr:MAG: deoxyribodipyrimidine photo-lyase [Sphaerobacteraceae bacterium]